MNKKDKAIKQAMFCQEMLNRIIGDLHESDYQSKYRWNGYTSIRNDIVHLRRELLRLSKIMNLGE